MNLFKLISFILNPQKAIDYANENKSNKYIVGFINEFFSKYLEFGKSNKEIVDLNEKIDHKIQTKNKIANALIKLREIRKEIKQVNSDDQIIKTAKNFGVSRGIATGIVLNIKSTKQFIPKDYIGIFPTSGVKYTTQFLKCKGIIFKNGGITSHGAILAREKNIPAVVFSNIKIADNKLITINGLTGKIQTVDRKN